MTRCWHTNPALRPTSKELIDIIKGWGWNPSPEIKKQIRVAEDFRIQGASEYDPVESYSTHPLAIYTSKALPNVNLLGNQGLNKKGWCFYFLVQHNCISFMNITL